MGKNNVEEQKSIVRTSVRDLVEFLLRSGDIDHRKAGQGETDAMLAGAKMHRKIQNRMGPEYASEVNLKKIIPTEQYDIVIEGRADGVFTEEQAPPNEENWLAYHLLPQKISLKNKKTLHGQPALSEIGRYEKNCIFENAGGSQMDTSYENILRENESLIFIDEIKCVYKDLNYIKEPVPVHLAQAMCYAYIYAEKEALSRIGVQMTYCNLDTEKIKYFRIFFSMEDLSVWFENLMEEYQKWADFQFEWRKKRQASITPLEFPYPYRNGQKKLVGDVYRSIIRKKTLFIQAPTGAGKTIATVFPAVKAVGCGYADRIFYLTAKTIAASAPFQAFLLLKKQGYQAKLIQITAKEKMCLCDEPECDPVHCEVAKGHFDRINDALFSLLTTKDDFTREVILDHARACKVCPYELSLDLSAFCDAIICDYNYVFDPYVALKRFFADGVRGDYLFLTDEAHNLVERARDMYSATLRKDRFLQVKRYMKKHSEAVCREIVKCNRILLGYKRECNDYVVMDQTADLVLALIRLAAQISKFLQKDIEFAEKKDFLDFYYEVRRFIETYDRLDKNYLIYSEQREDEGFVLKLYCVDPSVNLQQCIDKAVSAVFFSATFLPIGYYKSLLSTRKDNYAIYAVSDFERKNRFLAIGQDVSTKYERRTTEEFERIAAYIWNLVSAKKGNYMIFYPSYKVMGQIAEIFEKQYGVTKWEGKNDGSPHYIMQRQGMKESEREAFLETFQTTPEDTLVGFCIMGGIFGEGIDLTHDRLIGAAVVGTGIPQISNEREMLKYFFDDRYGRGFDYAYRYPGMNKVQQAAGRVIRTKEDVGVILLLDERFLQQENKHIFPREWDDFVVVNGKTVLPKIQEYWRNLYGGEYE